MSEKDKVIRIAVTPYDLHTILTALEFRAGMWDSEVSGDSDADDSNRDKDLLKKLEVFKAK